PARQARGRTGWGGAPRMSGRVEIEYCTQCRWLPRAAWLAQELLTTFEAELTELALKPGTGGVFVVRVDDEAVWDRRDGGFPACSNSTPALIHCQICEREISAVAASSMRLKMATAPRPRSHASM